MKLFEYSVYKLEKLRLLSKPHISICTSGSDFDSIYLIKSILKICPGSKYFEEHIVDILFSFVLSLIIGLLSSVVMSVLNDARIKARDTQRVFQIKELQKAIEVYVSDYGKPPVCSISKINSNEWCGNCTGTDTTKFDTALKPLVDGKYISKIPSDPRITGGSTNCMAYEYYTLPDLSTSDDPSTSDPLDKWRCGSNYGQTIADGAVNVTDYSYAIRFSTEKNIFGGFLKFVWNRTPDSKGQEYCVLGQKIR
jgi:type II secretory pathway pseudopilin PulG